MMVGYTPVRWQEVAAKVGEKVEMLGAVSRGLAVMPTGNDPARERAVVMYMDGRIGVSFGARASSVVGADGAWHMRMHATWQSFLDKATKHARKGG